MSTSAAVRSSTVDDIARRAAQSFRDRVAVRFQDRTWTYAELDHAVDAVAAHLRTLGLDAGARIAAYGRNSDAYLIAFLACSRAGFVHVPINYNLVARELNYLIEQSGSTAVLVDPALRPQLEALDRHPGTAIALRDEIGSIAEIAHAADAETPHVKVDPGDGDVVQLLYTSGTTSLPKGAIITHRALIHEYVSCLQALELTGADAPLHVMPLYHSAQMHVLLVPALMVGAENTIVETPEPGDILRRLREDGHRAFFAAPTLWVALANHPDFEQGLGGLRKAYYGASIMPVPVLKRLQEMAPELGFYNLFGQSEISPLATVLKPAEHADRPDSAGRPALFVEARVVDGEGNDVSTGELGEIVYRSPQLCEGYWDKPQETQAAFNGGWFHSGDLVRMDEQGYIFVVDRIKDVINTGGVLVASRDVEDALYTHPQVAEVAVVGLADDKWIEAITAYVVPKGQVSAQELIEHTRGQIASYKVPKRVIFVNELPRNASGKILKRELRS
ncbi:fatty acyl-CoA synthetase [Leekyejoonella antrihumi]|uniref:AMP-binding protein n=1 Tax=Leekyejoonella antrihumi TaxID=1660198 RepID=A0A563E901_9MICO|nr:fatty acyl-CoA synthetase [Leekyejoonella antrihumi]TWP39048.1 AMP-binding protein [Leekyejoonella antrihumi]